MSGLPTPTQAIHAALRAIDSSLENVGLAAEAVHTSLSPLPPVTSDYNEGAPDSLIAQGIGAIRAQIRRGLPVTAPPTESIAAILDGVATKDHFTEGLDDRKLALELALTFLSRSPKNNTTIGLEQRAIALLYRDLPHPPSTQMGPSYQFRTADGSGNSRLDPTMGQSFTPYSRSCSTTRNVPPIELPDAALVFDALIRRDKFVPHPAGLSGLFFNFATSVIHSVFRTSRNDWNINETSSYADLGLLYGNNQAQQDKVRNKDGRGRLLPDVFTETRLLSLPPGVSALIVSFNRNHNYVADTIWRINERGTWTTDLETLAKDPAKLLQQDDQIFNTARLINAVTYANVILGDYLAGILGTVRDGSSWTLDIAGERRQADHTLLERGQGNSCSVEFNTLYRLHPSMSAEDAQYAERAFQGIFNKGQPLDFDSLTPEDFERKVSGLLAPKLHEKDGTIIPPATYDALSEAELRDLQDDGKAIDYLQLNIPGFQRDPETKLYNDDQLAGALQAATTVPAAAFKARGVPGVMRVIEILGIEQARNWGCCTLNDFRRFLGLKPYSSFEQWNPDKNVADAARKLYRNIENLELYVGLVAEESKPVGDGAGLCPSYTMSRAILADAVALVRGDRYLTYDCTPFNLTAWGFTDASRNTENAAWGGQLGRVLARALPNNYDAESVYTHFPLITPTGQPHSIDKTLTRINLIDQYSLTRPVKKLHTHVVADPKALYAAFAEEGNAKLVTTYTQNIKDIKLSPSFLTVIDDPAAYARVTKLVQDVFVPKDSLKQLGEYFYDKTIELLREKSFSLVDRSTHSVDLVKDVTRLIPVHWVSAQIAGLPLKTSFEPRGIYYEQQMYQMLKEIYSFIYIEADYSLKIPHRLEAKENIERLLRFVKLSLREAKGGLPGSVLGSVASLFLGDGRQHVNAVLKRLLALGSPIDEIANDILGVISTASIELSQIFAHVINFYLPGDPPSSYAHPEVKADHQRALDLRSKIISVAQSNSADSSALLEGYVREALRLDPALDGVYRVATADGSVGSVSFQKDERLWFDFRTAGKDGTLFQNPQDVDPTRSPSLYPLLHGDGVFKVLGADFVYRVAGQVLRAVITQPNLKRTKGPSGTLRRFLAPAHQKPDQVIATKSEVEVVVPGTNGQKTGYADVYSYTVKPVPAQNTFRWQYQDPENAFRLTNWATGLTVTYEDPKQNKRNLRQCGVVMFSWILPSSWFEKRQLSKPPKGSEESKTEKPEVGA